MAFLGFPFTCFLIITAEFFQVFTFFAVSFSKAAYLTQTFGFSNAEADRYVGAFQMLSLTMCFLGAYLADEVMGRFATIVIMLVLLATGTFMTALATEQHVQSRMLFFIGSLGLLPIGMGGLKPLVSTFGADQIGGTNFEAKQQRFFAFFYWALNIAAVAASPMATLATAPEDFGLPAGQGFFIAYSSAAVSVLFGLLCFLAGTGSYKHRHGGESNKGRVVGELCQALMYSARRSIRGRVSLIGWMLTVPFFVVSLAQALISGHRELQDTLAWISLVICVVQFCCLIWAHRDNSFLTRGSLCEGDSLSLQDLRLTFQTIPMLLAANLAFAVPYSLNSQPQNRIPCQMNLRFGGSMQINGSIVTLGNFVAVLVVLPLWNLLVPVVDRWRRRRTTEAEKILLGLLVLSFSCISGVFIEVARRHSKVLAPPGWSASATASVRFPSMSSSSAIKPFMGQCLIDHVDYCSNCAAKLGLAEGDSATAGIYMSDLSVFWMFIPLFLGGTAEIMINPLLLYFAYGFTPPSTRSVVQAINLVFGQAYPAAMTTVLITLFQSAVPRDLNRGTAFGLAIGVEVFYYVGLASFAITIPLMLSALGRTKLVNISIITPTPLGRSAPLLDHDPSDED